MNAFRPLLREASIAYYRWALHDLQITNPTHPDMNRVVLRLRDLRAERYARPCILRRTLEWL